MSALHSIPRSIAWDALPSNSAPTVGSPSVRAATWSTSAWLWRAESVRMPMASALRPSSIRATAACIRLPCSCVCARSASPSVRIDSAEARVSRIAPAGRSPATLRVARRASTAPASPAPTRASPTAATTSSRGTTCAVTVRTVTPTDTQPTRRPSASTGTIVRSDGPRVPVNSSVIVCGDGGIVPM